jgi:hypothetical protein
LQVIHLRGAVVAARENHVKAISEMTYKNYRDRLTVVDLAGSSPLLHGIFTIMG